MEKSRIGKSRGRAGTSLAKPGRAGRPIEAASQLGPPTHASASRPGGDRVFVALLRGINVGGRNRLRMKDLAAMFKVAGAPSIRTYIQSGNVVYRSAAREAERIARSVRVALARRLGAEVPIALRGGSDLERVLSSNPFLTAGRETRTLHVGFLTEIPLAERVAALDSKPWLPDEFSLQGREIYLYLPNGAARTKLTSRYFDARLEIPSTFRNWRTVTKLAGMARDLR